MIAGKPVNVLYIAGEGRSGSTLLSNILGRVQGVFSGGEIAWIWARGMLANESCGCRKPFHNCPEWQAILKRGFGDLSGIDSKDLSDIWRASVRTRRLLTYSLGGSRWVNREDVQRYLQVLEQLYLSIASHTECDFIVDSSKSPGYAFLLSQIKNINLFILHLVRDPRAVAFSRLRYKKRPEDEDFMVRFRPSFSASLWLAINLSTELLRRRLSKPDQYLRLRYEDLARDPITTIKLIEDSVHDFPPTEDKDILERSEALIHSVSGNPARFQEGKLEIRIDDEWISHLGNIHKFVVSTLTFPLLVRYGYLGKDSLYS